MFRIPVIVINGILEAGKTWFLKDAIAVETFVDKSARGLILVCESGEEEYDVAELKKLNTEVYQFGSPEEFDEKTLKELVKKYHPDVIYIEANEMWGDKCRQLPSYFEVQQQITVIDASTFKVYFNNMRQKFTDMLKDSDIVMMNRCDDDKAVGSYRRNLLLINSNLNFMLFDSDGNSVTLAEDLPYNLDADSIELQPEDYGTWYIDTFESPDRYKNKRVKFLAECKPNPKLPEGFFVAGRKVMTCCVNDIRDFVMACRNDTGVRITRPVWAILTVSMVYVQAPDGSLQMHLVAENIETVAAPDKAVVGLN